MNRYEYAVNYMMELCPIALDIRVIQCNPTPSHKNTKYWEIRIYGINSKVDNPNEWPKKIRLSSRYTRYTAWRYAYRYMVKALAESAAILENAFEEGSTRNPVYATSVERFRDKG